MLGLWGTSDRSRVAVSQNQSDPEMIIGYVREVGPMEWVAEGDPKNRHFNTPGDAAHYGYAVVWRTAATDDKENVAP
jgi:hypothetical protein